MQTEKKWRLMTHNEMERDYRNNDHADHYIAYLTDYPEGHNDPLYSIIVCDGNSEERNLFLALEIIVHLNYEDC